MCTVQGCKCNKIFAKNICQRHYTQMRKYGKISDQINNCENIINIINGVAVMDLYDKCGNKIAETIFDIEDANKARNDAAKKYYKEFANEI